MEGATVRLDLHDRPPMIVTTGPDGSYVLRPRNLPEHVAVSASKEGYTPESVNIPAEELAPGIRHDFALHRAERDIIALEDDPEVHHLGNDEFEGRINSQFQKPSEGLTWERRYTLTRDQTPPAITRAEIVLLAKGCQAPNEIRVNGRLLDQRLTGSPGDGSFGEFRARFPADWLVEGENTISIRSVRGTADLDDFEFVNVQVRLSRTGVRITR
jgi:hypothetical protein